jgi:hypothetical protein
MCHIISSKSTENTSTLSPLPNRYKIFDGNIFAQLFWHAPPPPPLQKKCHHVQLPLINHSAFKKTLECIHKRRSTNVYTFLPLSSVRILCVNLWSLNPGRQSIFCCTIVYRINYHLFVQSPQTKKTSTHVTYRFFFFLTNQTLRFEGLC